MAAQHSNQVHSLLYKPVTTTTTATTTTTTTTSS